MSVIVSQADGNSLIFECRASIKMSEHIVLGVVPDGGEGELRLFQPNGPRAIREVIGQIIHHQPELEGLNGCSRDSRR